MLGYILFVWVFALDGKLDCQLHLKLSIKKLLFLLLFYYHPTDSYSQSLFGIDKFLVESYAII
jgi:hypothetical protein